MILQSQNLKFWLSFIIDQKILKTFTLREVNAKQYNNAKNLFDKLLSIYYNDCINIPDKEKEDMGEIYDPSKLLIKGYRFVESKKEDKEKSKSHPEETIAEGVKLADDEDLSDISQLEGDFSDECIDISKILPLEDDKKEVKEEKGLKMFNSKQFIN